MRPHGLTVLSGWYLLAVSTTPAASFSQLGRKITNLFWFHQGFVNVFRQKYVK